MIEVTEWASDVLTRSQEAASRFNPEARIRLVRSGNGVEAQLAEGPAPGDQTVRVADLEVYVEADLDGVVDVQEPHDQLVLRQRA